MKRRIGKRTASLISEGVAEDVGRLFISPLSQEYDAMLADLMLTIKLRVTGERPNALIYAEWLPNASAIIEEKKNRRRRRLGKPLGNFSTQEATVRIDGPRLYDLGSDLAIGLALQRDVDDYDSILEELQTFQKGLSDSDARVLPPITLFTLPGSRRGNEALDVHFSQLIELTTRYPEASLGPLQVIPAINPL